MESNGVLNKPTDEWSQLIRCFEKENSDVGVERKLVKEVISLKCSWWRSLESYIF